MRDAHQSLLATRMRTKELLEAADVTGATALPFSPPTFHPSPFLLFFPPLYPIAGLSILPLVLLRQLSSHPLHALRVPPHAHGCPGPRRRL